MKNAILMTCLTLLLTLPSFGFASTEVDSAKLRPDKTIPVNLTQTYILDSGTSPLLLIEDSWQLVASTAKRCVPGYSPTYKVSFLETKYVSGAINDINRIMLDTSQNTGNPYEIWADNVYASTPGATSDTPIQFTWEYYCVAA